MSLFINNAGTVKSIARGGVHMRHAGAIKQVEQIWIKRNGVWHPVWASTFRARFGVAQFSDTDFTGGKEYPNQAGEAYTQWAGPQDFIDSALTHNYSSAQSSLQVELSMPFPQYAYFAHPQSYGIAEFIDNANGFPGGWDGITWGDGTIGEIYGPVTVVYDDGSGPENWYVYRTDFSGIGNMSWTVHL